MENENKENKIGEQDEIKKVRTENEIINSKEVRNQTTTQDEEIENAKSVNSKNKKEKKPKTLKQIIFGRIIFIIIVMAIVVGTVYYFVMQNNEKNNNTQKDNIVEKVKEIAKEEDTKYSAVDLDGTYYTNPLKCETKTEENSNFDGKELKYIEIDGLKDKKLQEEINQKIRDNIDDFVQTTLEKNPEALSFETSAVVEGNFANIISIEYIVTIENKGNNYKYYTKGINYNLVNGEKLKLEDVLGPKSKISNILLEKLYNSIAQSYVDFNDGTGYAVQSKDSSNIEEDIYKIVSDFQRGKDVNFYVCPSTLYIADEDFITDAEIMFQGIADDVIIYDRFNVKTNLYDGKYEKVGPFNNLVTELFVTYKILEHKENYYIDVSLVNSTKDSNEKVDEKIKDYINKSVVEFKQKAKDDSNHFYALNSFYECDEHNNENDGNYRVYGTKYSLITTKTIFENKTLPQSLESLRNNYFSGSYETNMMYFRTDTDEPYFESDHIILDKNGNILKSGDIDVWQTID